MLIGGDGDDVLTIGSGRTWAEPRPEYPIPVTGSEAQPATPGQTLTKLKTGC
jgi:hypothetical protein